MGNFKPTWLYVKQCPHCGLRYLGKTTSKNPDNYRGSGKHWLRHLDKHGVETPLTVWSKRMVDQEICIWYALLLSESNDVVKSKSWANLKTENGLDGGYAPQFSKNNHRFGKRYYTSLDGSSEYCLEEDDPQIESRQLVPGRKDSVVVASRQANLANTNGVGKVWTQQSRIKNSLSNKAYGHAEFLGKSHTEQSKILMSINNTRPNEGKKWYNDGVKQFLLYPNDRKRLKFLEGCLPMSDDTRHKIRVASLRRPPASDHTRALRSFNASTRIVSEATKAKLRETKLGDKNPLYGKSWKVINGKRTIVEKDT